MGQENIFLNIFEEYNNRPYNVLTESGEKNLLQKIADKFLAALKKIREFLQKIWNKILSLFGKGGGGSSSSASSSTSDNNKQNDKKKESKSDKKTTTDNGVFKLKYYNLDNVQTVTNKMSAFEDSKEFGVIFTFLDELEDLTQAETLSDSQKSKIPNNNNKDAAKNVIDKYYNEAAKYSKIEEKDINIKKALKENYGKVLEEYNSNMDKAFKELTNLYKSISESMMQTEAMLNDVKKGESQEAKEIQKNKDIYSGFQIAISVLLYAYSKGTQTLSTLLNTITTSKNSMVKLKSILQSAAKNESAIFF